MDNQQGRLARQPTKLEGRYRSVCRFMPPLIPDEPDHRLALRAAMASTFVAGLELARNGTAYLAQGEAFGPVHLAAADHQRARVFDSVAA